MLTSISSGVKKTTERFTYLGVVPLYSCPLLAESPKEKKREYICKTAQHNYG